MATFHDIRKRAVGGLLAGLNRADELGGEVRDFLQDRVLRDERYVRARKRLAGLMGKRYVSRAEREQDQAEASRAAAAAAPPPAAQSSAAAGPQALGDPSLPAQIYGKSSCPWTGRAITLLEQLKTDYDFIDLDDPDNEHFVARLIPETTQNTTPWIYVRGQFVGGFNALDELRGLGQLEFLLMSAAERVKANPAMAKVTVLPRPNSDEVAPGEQ